MSTARKTARAAFALLAVLLTLTLVVGNPTTAEAATVPAPVTIGETMAVPAGAVMTGGEVGSTGAGICLTTGAETAGIGCVVAAGVMLALGLYLTRDAWMPVADKIWSKTLGKLGGTGVNCHVSVGNVVPSADGRGILADMTTSSDCNYFGQARESALKQMSTGYCVNGTNALPFAASVGTMGGMGLVSVASGGAAQTFSVPTLCPPGYTVGFVQLEAVWDWWNGGGVSQVFTYGTTPTADQFSQITSVDCKDLTGDIHTITAQQTGKQGQVLLPSCADAYPGSVPVGVRIAGGWPGAEQQVASQTLLDPRTSYPDCFDSGGHLLSTCRVRVFINDVPCTSGVAGCNDPRTYHEDNPESEISCRWGPYTVAFENCDALKNHYSGQTKTVTSVDTKTGTPVLDPTTPDVPGDSIIDVCTSSCTNPPVPPACTALPGSHSSAADCSPTASEKSCIGGAWSWDPIKWVYVPVKCALMWAFVPPDGSFEAAMNRITSPVSGAFGPWDDAVSSGWTGVSAGTGSCQGMQVTLPKMFTDAGLPASFYPFAACSGTAATLAGYCRTISTVFLTFFAVVKTVELLQAGLGLSTHAKIIGSHSWDDQRQAGGPAL